MSPAIVHLVEERRRNWRMLEYLSGLHIERLHASHRAQLDEWRERYEVSVKERESSIDDIARGMSELAAASSAPAGGPSIATVPVSAITTARQEAPGAAPGGAGRPLVEITEIAKCTNCKTCYQDVSELFEKTTIVVAGDAKEVSRVIPGILDKIKPTPDLIRRASRLASDCDAEIIRFHQPN